MIYYFIINLVATQEANQLIFWGTGAVANTADKAQALIVNEEHLNVSLERYDNGATTRAILADVVRNHTGDWRELINPTIPAQTGEAV